MSMLTDAMVFFEGFSNLLYRNNHLQLHIGKKTHEGEVKLFSTSSRSCTVKQPWGCILDCKFPVNNSCFGLKNKQGSSQAFQKSQLDPSLWKICPFTTSWLAMRAEGKEEKLARFVSHMLKCKQFVHHPSDENYDNDGLDLRHNTLTEEERV